MNSDAWQAVAGELRAALENPATDDVVLQSESVSSVGAVTLDTVIEAVGGDAESQRLGYQVVCDLMATRLKQGAGQVLGCLLIDGEPDTGALVEGLNGMLRPDGTFTPVLPLSAAQAQSLVDADLALFDILDPATALLEVAASRPEKTELVAQDALEEIDELIARRTTAQ